VSQTKRTRRIPAPTASVRAGRIDSGEPLLLLHPFTTSHDVWAEVIPGLEGEFDVVAATLPGHWGGPAIRFGDVSLAAYADAIERLMDDLGWETAHIAGNSIGGWLSFELARRGRARSITAIAPAGGWTKWSREEIVVGLKFLGLYPLTALGHVLGDRLLGLPPVRSTALKLVSHRPGRVSRDRAANFLRASTNCPSMFPFIVSELRNSTVVDVVGIDEEVPVRLVLCEQDLIIPAEHYGEPYVRALPHADVVRMPDVGHIPMFEKPDVVADLIAEHALRHTAMRVADAG